MRAVPAAGTVPVVEGVGFWEWVAKDGIGVAASWVWEWLLSPAWVWTWEHGLDGIGGGVLGGVIAWKLLQRTVEHERNQQEAALLHAEEQATAAGLAQRQDMLREAIAVAQHQLVLLDLGQPVEAINATQGITRAVIDRLQFAELASRTAKAVHTANELGTARVPFAAVSFDDPHQALRELAVAKEAGQRILADAMDRVMSTPPERLREI